MSSILLGLEDGVEGEKGTAAIHGVSFSHPAGGSSEGFELLRPLFLAEGERGAVFFASMKGEAEWIVWAPRGGGVNRCYSNFNSFSNLGLTQR
jgi:hypothetical protein